MLLGSPVGSDLEPYRDRRLFVRALMSRAEAVYEVRDEDPGFNPDTIPDPMDPTNLDKARAFSTWV